MWAAGYFVAPGVARNVVGRASPALRARCSTKVLFCGEKKLLKPGGNQQVVARSSLAKNFLPQKAAFRWREGELAYSVPELSEKVFS